MAFLAKLITIHYIFRASSRRLFQPIFHPNLENETIQKFFFEEIVRDALMVDIYIYIYMLLDPQHLCKFHVFWYCQTMLSYIILLSFDVSYSCN